jgi:hypothetical protein
MFYVISSRILGIYNESSNHGCDLLFNYLIIIAEKDKNYGRVLCTGHIY